MIAITDTTKEQKYINCMKSAVRGQTNVHIISGDLEWDTAAKISANRNLIPYPYNFTSSTIKGITATANSDGSILLNGTNDGTGSSSFSVQRVDLDEGIYVLSGGKVISSGKYVSLNITLYKNNKRVKSYTNIVGRGTVIDNSDSLYDYGSLSVVVSSGVAISNLTIKPQIERGQTPTEFTPYIGMPSATKPIQLVNIKRDIDPLGRELPSIVLEWEEIRSDNSVTDYTTSVKVGQMVTLTVNQDVSENFDNSETVNLEYPILFISQKPEISDTAIKYKAVDIVTLTNTVTIKNAYNISDVKDTYEFSYGGVKNTFSADTQIGTTTPRLKNIIANILLELRKAWFGNEVIRGILGTIANVISQNIKQDSETGDFVTDIEQLETQITTPFVVDGCAWDCIKNLLANVNMYIDFTTAPEVVRLKRFLYASSTGEPVTDFYLSPNSDRRTLQLTGMFKSPTLTDVPGVAYKARFNTNGWSKTTSAVESDKTSVITESPVASYEYIGTTDSNSYVATSTVPITYHTGGSFYLLYFPTNNPTYETVITVNKDPNIDSTTIDTRPTATGIYVLIYTTCTKEEFENLFPYSDFVCYHKEVEQTNNVFERSVDFGIDDGEVYEENNPCNFLTENGTETFHRSIGLAYYFSGWTQPDKVVAEVTHAGDYSIEPSDIITTTIFKDGNRRKELTGVVVSTDLKWQGYTEEKITIHEWVV